MIERRRHPRNPTRQRAFIVLASPQPPVPCVIRDYSPFGALVELRNLLSVPKRFHLLLGGTDLVPCRLVRNAATELGVAFECEGGYTSPLLA